MSLDAVSDCNLIMLILIKLNKLQETMLVL